MANEKTIMNPREVNLTTPEQALIDIVLGRRKPQTESEKRFAAEIEEMKRKGVIPIMPSNG